LKFRPINHNFLLNFRGSSIQVFLAHKAAEIPSKTHAILYIFKKISIILTIFVITTITKFKSDLKIIKTKLTL